MSKYNIEIDPPALKPNTSHVKTVWKVNSKPDFTGVSVLDTTSTTDLLSISIDKVDDAKYLSYQYIISDNGNELTTSPTIVPLVESDYHILAYPAKIDLDRQLLKDDIISLNIHPPEFYNGTATHISTDYYIKDIYGNTLISRENEIANKDSIILDIHRVKFVKTLLVEAKLNFSTEVLIPPSRLYIPLDHTSSLSLSVNHLSSTTDNSIGVLGIQDTNYTIKWTLEDLEHTPILSGTTSTVIPIAANDLANLDTAVLNISVSTNRSIQRDNFTLEVTL